MNYDTEQNQGYSGIGGSPCLYVYCREGNGGVVATICCLLVRLRNKNLPTNDDYFDQYLSFVELGSSQLSTETLHAVSPGVITCNRV